jgi:protein arginine kinase activator
VHCDHCDKAALVHEVVIRNGKRREVHLCEDHAKEAGYVIPSGEPLNALLSQVIAAVPPIAKAARATPQPACAACGLAFHVFRQTGVLGCAACYEAFGATLGSLIEKAQAGAVHHVGKTPRRGGGAIDLLMLRQRLERELHEAVAAEQYERAAKLRDRIRGLSEPSRRGCADAGADPAEGASGAGVAGAMPSREIGSLAPDAEPRGN